MIDDLRLRLIASTREAVMRIGRAEGADGQRLYLQSVVKLHGQIFQNHKS